jgi:hypothetical protein
MLQWAVVPPRTVMKISGRFSTARDFFIFFLGPVDSKVLTPGAVGKRGLDKVVDSKKMTPAKERNADESKDSRRGVAAIEATVCREGPGRPNPID